MRQRAISRKQKGSKNKIKAAWGDIFHKIEWLALKTGKPVVPVPAKHSSQECPKCGHSLNSWIEKRLCEL